MTYTLYNKRLKRRLTHPRIGLWFTNDLQEAQEMLTACQQYLSGHSLDGLHDDFCIIEIESGEEIKTEGAV
jgi:hypothetical protein